MQILPVLDLMGGVVVHGRGGRRDSYRPIASPLGSAEDAAGLARALLREADAGTLYVADLDAIEGKPLQAGALTAIRDGVPAAQLWVDGGFADPAAARSLPPGLRPVFGSESLQSVPSAWPPDSILSLDFAGACFRGPAELLNRSDSWPCDIIVMTLAAVGSDAGPDMARIADIVRRAGGRRVFAAGGVRNREDLAALHEAGCHGALVASALHAGRLRGP